MQRLLPIVMLLASFSASGQQVLDSIINYSITHTVNKDSLVIGKVYFTYDDKARVVERLKMRSDDLINWYPDKRREYVYDSRGRMQTGCNDSFYAGTQTWKRFKCDSFNYLDNSDTLYEHLKLQLSGKPARGITSYIEYGKTKGGKLLHTLQYRLDGSSWTKYTVDSFMTGKMGSRTINEHKNYFFDKNKGSILQIHDIEYINPANPFLDKFDSTVRLSYGTNNLRVVNRYAYNTIDSLVIMRVKTINLTSNYVSDNDSTCYHMRTASDYDSMLRFYYYQFDSSWRFTSGEWYTWDGTTLKSVVHKSSNFITFRADYDKKPKLRAFDTVIYQGSFRKHLDRWAFDKDDRIKSFTIYDFGTIDDSLKVRNRSHYYYGDLVTGVPKPEVVEMAVFPNPSKGLVYIKLNEELPLVIIDQLGKEIYRASGQDKYQVQIDQPGVYVIVTGTSRRKLVVR